MARYQATGGPGVQSGLARRCWRLLVGSARVLNQTRSAFRSDSVELVCIQGGGCIVICLGGGGGGGYWQLFHLCQNLLLGARSTRIINCPTSMIC